MTGYPDWTRAIRLLGIDGDGNPVTVLLDATGRLHSLIIGQDAEGDPLAVRVDSDGQMIMVPRGSSGNYMAVDSDGFITAVLKGAYGEALRTIGLDAEGRITAYILDDESQWGDVIKVGNAEMAARLGSPVAYDWRGKVVWLTDFRSGLGGMKSSASGVGASVTLDPTHFVSGGYSAKIVGGSSGTLESYLAASIDVPPTARIGLYARWCSDSYFDFLDLLMEITDGTRFYEATLRYDKDAAKLYYLDDEQAFQLLVDQAFITDDSAWHGLKLVVDIGASTYSRCLAGNSEHDMSELAMRSLTSGASQSLFCGVQIHSHSGNNEYCWVDSMIITVGEPT